MPKGTSKKNEAKLAAFLNQQKKNDAKPDNRKVKNNRTRS